MVRILPEPLSDADILVIEHRNNLDLRQQCFEGLNLWRHQVRGTLNAKEVLKTLRSGLCRIGFKQVAGRFCLFIVSFLSFFFCFFIALFIHFEDSLPSLGQNAGSIICVQGCIFNVLNFYPNFQRMLLTCPSEICAGKNSHLNHLKCEMDTKVPHLHIRVKLFQE